MTSMERFKQTDWYQPLLAELGSDYFEQLEAFLDEVYDVGQVFPAKQNVFRAFELTSLAQTRVVILGQDPYHGEGQADGLSFSVPDGVAPPPSLRNIFKELETDLGVRERTDLSDWAQSGVLLLNSVLTVSAGQANSHQGRIWEALTDAVISLVGRRTELTVFILWGKFAQKKKALIGPGHVILESVHPSPLSAYRGFFGSRPFSKANTFLENPIDWLGGKA